MFPKMGEWPEWLVNGQQEKGEKFGKMSWVFIKSGLISYGENLGFLRVIGNNGRVAIRGVSRFNLCLKK